MAHPFRCLVPLLLLTALAGCAALRDDMKRAEDAYQQARYDEALVWLDDLERDTPDMNEDMRAKFYFLRGMTAYRLGHRDHALHYLALAREVSGEQSTGTLLSDEYQLMERTLTELTPQDAAGFHARDLSSGGDSGGASSDTPSP